MMKLEKGLTCHRPILLRLYWCCWCIWLLLPVHTSGEEDFYRRRRQLQKPEIDVVTTSNNPSNLGLCEGDCDKDEHCQDGLVCFQKDRYEAVPGCDGGESDASKTDYCINPITPTPTSAPTPPNIFDRPPPIRTGKLKSYGGSPPSWRFPLGICEGDCDEDSDCESNLMCFQRNPKDLVPGCIGSDSSKTDYCADPNAVYPPVDDGTIEYTPGKLTVQRLGLLLSEGLDATLIATSGQHVLYDDGNQSWKKFHYRPDGAATFPDTREGNEGGWVYVSNSEMPERHQGGVGAITFDANGKVIDYQMVLDHTTMNCGGGRTPWNTWVSCEEFGSSGHLFQVDPTGKRSPEQLVLGSDGGNYESFAYDIRNASQPHFFVTEDSSVGPLRRFTPNNPDWDQPWSMLHGGGTIDYLKLNVENSSEEGTFEWISSKDIARQNANQLYPLSEGIDVFESELYFVCKGIKMIYTLNLDSMTWFRKSTVSGLFDGQPDQMARLVNNTNGLLYFTEEGGVDAGIHARDSQSRFYTIMESPEYSGETTGLSLSPDGKFMYVAYQKVGKLFCLWRRDGKAFGSEQLDIKFHEVGSG